MAKTEEKQTADDKSAAEVKGAPPPEIPPLLKTIWKIHPYLMLGAAAMLAAAAYLLIPKREAEKIKPLFDYYQGIIDALHHAKVPLRDMPPEKLLQAVIHAKTDSDYIFQTSPYREELATDPRLINPYLLYAESLALYAKHPQIILQDRKAMLQRAVWAYARAGLWESKDWDEREQKIYDRQFFSAGEAYDESVLQARKRLRHQYIDYMTALAAIEADQLNLAEEKLNKILTDLRWENNPANAGVVNQLTTGRLPPHEFELLPEDLTNLYFYLAKLSEKRGDRAEAERYYRIFLLHARRGAEYFAALLRLGYFNFNAAQVEEKNDREKARRLYYEASTIFSRIVADSPPGEILREAYFTGGRALFNMALTIPITEKTYWDRVGNLGEKLQTNLEKFSGNPLPARTHYVLPALARLAAASGLTAPDPLTLCTAVGSGTLLALTVKNRLTTLGERARLLQRADTFFTGAQGGDGHYDGAANVMLARIYLAEGDYQKARNLLKYTVQTFGTPEINDACLFSEADSFFQEGEIDRAYLRFVGGVEKLTNSLLVPEDIKSWPQLCVELSSGAASTTPNPAKQVWTFLHGELQSVIDKTAISKVFPERFRLPLVKNLNLALNQENFYSPINFARLDLPPTAQILLHSNLVLLTLENREWLNRMLFDAGLRSTILPTAEGAIIPPFPAENELHPSELLTATMVREVLLELARRYAKMARPENNVIALDADEATQRLQAAAPRRYLQQAIAINVYLLEHYRPENAGELLLENAYLLARGAQLAAAPPFRDLQRARELLARSGLAFMEVSRDERYLNLEEEALLEAGKNFYAAGRYGQASEALATFVRNYTKSDRIGWASNLLGRCYWYMGRYNDAIRVFRDNAARRTPDGYESLFYLGAVYLDAGTTEDELDNKVKIDRLGNPNDLYAPISLDGVLATPKNALQVFNEIRRLPGIEPESRPWRWATFALGKTWYEIAEREKRNEVAAAARENRRPLPIKWSGYFANAEKYLRESLDRYRLADGDAAVGTQKSKEPEDYEDIRRQRLESEYFLALTLRELNAEHPDSDTEYEMRKLFDDVINPSLYPNAMFAPFLDQDIPPDNSLGFTNGQIVRPRYLESLRRNAFFMLANSWKQLGQDLEKKAGRLTPEAAEAFEEALKIYRRARDRLSPQDSPQILYNIGDTLYNLGRTEDAGRMFLMVASQVAQMESVEKRPEFSAEIRIWRTLAENRLRDLENLK